MPSPSQDKLKVIYETQAETDPEKKRQSIQFFMLTESELRMVIERRFDAATRRETFHVSGNSLPGEAAPSSDLHVTENGQRIGSKEWVARATKDGDDRVKLQYYGLTKVQWDDVVKDAGVVINVDLAKEMAARTISFTGQGEKDYVAEAEKKRADEADKQKSKEFWTSPAVWVAIAGGVGLLAIFYMRS